jgi:quercetin dioxygenase-like cupin family protein
MRITKNLHSVNIKRREVMVAGLAGASALLVGKSGSAYAQPIEEKGKVERKELKKAVESMIPGFPKVRLREVTYQPGASTKAKMQNAMVCECTQGTLEVMRDDTTFTAKKGDIWTCKVGMVEGNANKGKTPATMRVFDLLSA